MKLKKNLFTIYIIIILLLISGCKKNMEAGSVPKDKEPETNEVEKPNLEASIDLTPVSGGQVIIPLTTFSTLNPLMTDNVSYYHFSKLIFENLFDFNDNLEMVAKLAEDYSISEDGKRISIKLRDNIKWHDGKDFTTSDVAFTIDTIRQGGNASIYGKILEGSLAPLERINIGRALTSKIIDDKNIDVFFNKAYSNKLEVLNFPIVPKHLYINKYGRPDYKLALAISNYKPIGTGPYKYVDYDNNKNLKLEKNEDYWGGLPYIDEIIGKVLGDEKSILNAFETGQVSFAATSGVDWDKYKQNTRIEVVEYISQDHEFMGFNFKNKLLEGERGIAIRKAMAYGINRQEIIETIYLTHGTQIDLPIYPNSYLVSEDGHRYGYNVERAKEELSKVGFKDRDNDGILEDEKGQKLSFRITTNSNNTLRFKTINKIAEDLREIGFEINIINNSNLEELENKMVKGDFDIILGGWTTSLITDLTPMFHSSMIKKGSNFINYRNKEMDNLLAKSLYSKNKEDKEANYEELQSLIVEDLPYIGLLFKNKGILMDTKIKGDLKPTYFNPYRGLDKCFIPKNLQ